MLIQRIVANPLQICLLATLTIMIGCKTITVTPVFADHEHRELMVATEGGSGNSGSSDTVDVDIYNCKNLVHSHEHLGPVKFKGSTSKESLRKLLKKLDCKYISRDLRRLAQ